VKPGTFLFPEDTALIVVDVQNDFCPGGALAARYGDRIVPVINAWMPRFRTTVASRDWHPPQSVHFEKWPVHCVAGSIGAAFHSCLDTARFTLVVDKGTGVMDDGYSAFEATSVNLEGWLRQRGIGTLYICGLATDYCVKQTVLDALAKGFHTVLIADAIEAVDVHPGDGDAALATMLAAGAHSVPGFEITHFCGEGVDN
jgi:nicotinamidase/pyrazinamidase